MSTIPEKHSHVSIEGMYADYFLNYASYAILDRAIPHIDDGLKPVQRRILHAMYNMDDGRYNKVANITGDTMKYHPHGNASIDAAIVNLGQKQYLIDTQGNWGNILTGDPAAASRYIEARLTKFAHDILFSPKATQWQLSYDGRNKEPIAFPSKFPLLLLQGAEGIAVGLSCKILPHNFNEVGEACIASLRNEPFTLIPDFPTGGIMDASDYRDGQRGGKIRVRARIVKESSKLLRITQIPFGTTTGDLIASILKAAEKNKIKIAKIEDNTAAEVDILVHLTPGTDAEQAIMGLYAFTDCELSVSPNTCVILPENKPAFLGVSDIIAHAAQRTKDVLKLEEEIKLGELNEQWHFSSLEKIFIEERIYRDIEECTTWKSVLETIAAGLEPFRPKLKRDITEEDLVRLTEIKIKRISKFNAFKADELIKGLEKDIAQTEKNLANLTRFTIRWFEALLKKYGALHPRLTEIEQLDSIDRSEVAAATETFYIDEDGFAGWGVKKGEPISKCSKLDDIIIITTDGTLRIVKIAEKFFAGKKLLYCNIYRKSENSIYNLVYRDGRDGPLMAKRFYIGGVIRDKDYDLLPGTPNSRIFHFSIHETEESSASVALNIHIKATLRMRNTVKRYFFSELGIKGRAARGNTVTKHNVEKVTRYVPEKTEESADTDTIDAPLTPQPEPSPIPSSPATTDAANTSPPSVEQEKPHPAPPPASPDQTSLPATPEETEEEQGTLF